MQNLYITPKPFTIHMFLNSETNFACSIIGMQKKNQLTWYYIICSSFIVSKKMYGYLYV